MSSHAAVKALCHIVESAGLELRERRLGAVSEKSGAGLVSELDQRLEATLRQALPPLWPGSVVVGEEEGGSPAEWTWWVDPLDGTTNCVHGWPRSAISVALYHHTAAELAAVHDPYLQETFWAVRGGGAWCGRTRLQLSSCHDLSTALLCTGFAPEQVRMQMFDFEPSDVGQQINPNGPNRHVIITPEVYGVLLPHQLYNNRSQNMGGILLENPGVWDHEPEDDISGQVTWRFAQIDGNQSSGRVGVVITDPQGSNTRILSGGSGVVWGGTQDPLDIIVDYTLIKQPSSGQVVIDMVAKIDGVQVFSVSGLPRKAGRWHDLLPLIPAFETSISGTYAIGAEEYDPEEPEGPAEATYFTLKGLTLEKSLQEFTLTPGEPANFSNSFRWDYGDNPLSLQEPSWDIKITAPDGAEITTLSGTGRAISTSWDSTSLEAVGPFRLKPKGQDSPDGGTPIYGYEIIIRALAYSDSGAGHFKWDANGYSSTFDDVFYEVSSAVSSQELKITNIELDPDPPFQNEGDMVTLTAEVVTVGLDDVSEDDIEWWVELIGPDGETVGNPLATGNGFAVEAEWNGTVDGVAVDDPGAYSFNIRANTCEEPVSPKQAEVRAQGTSSSQCYMAMANVPLAKHLLLETSSLLSSKLVGSSASSFPSEPDGKNLNLPGYMFVDSDSEIIIKLTDPALAVDSAPSEIEVKASLSDSHPSGIAVKLERDRSGRYEGTVRISSSLATDEASSRLGLKVRPTGQPTHSYFVSGPWRPFLSTRAGSVFSSSTK